MEGFGLKGVKRWGVGALGKDHMGVKPFLVGTTGVRYPFGLDTSRGEDVVVESLGVLGHGGGGKRKIKD